MSHEEVATNPSATSSASSSAASAATPAPGGAAAQSNKPLSFVHLKDYLKAYLSKMVAIWKGTVAMVIDPSVSPMLSCVAGMKFLLSSGVKQVFHLEYCQLVTDCDVILYVLRPSVPLVKAIAFQVKSHRDQKQEKQYACFFVPKPTAVCVKMLEAQGLYGDVRVSQLPMDLVPLDPDIASLQMDMSYRDIYLHPDRTVLFSVAESIFNLQFLYGLIPNITGKGHCAEIVKDLLVHMTTKPDPEAQGLSFVERHQKAKKTSHIKRVILIDRDLDMITPMMTQLTYEGMLDEVFGIHCGYITLEPWMYGLKDEEPGVAGAGAHALTLKKSAKYRLNSDDVLFAYLRDRNFGAVLSQLKTLVAGVKEEVEKDDPKGDSHGLASFVKKVPDIVKRKNMITTHVNIAKKATSLTEDEDFMKTLRVEGSILEQVEMEEVRDLLENFCHRQRPIARVLRLLVMYSLVHGGLKPKDFDFFRELVLKCYGYEHLLTLHNLETLQLFTSQQSNTRDMDWKKVTKACRLITPGVDTNDPSDFSFTYSSSGYAPLSVRLLESYLTSGRSWSHVDAQLKKFPSFSYSYPLAPPPSTSASSSSSTDASAPPNKRTSVDLTKPNTEEKDEDGVTLVYIIGGVTYAEVSALRFLQQKKIAPSLLLATTQFLNGGTLVESLIEKIDKSFTKV